VDLMRYLLERASGPSAVRRALVLEGISRRFRRASDALPAEGYLARANLQLVRQAFRRPERSVWTSIFAPAELLHAFRVHPLCLEALASAAAGIGLAPMMLDQSDHLGVLPHVCGYHRALVGLVARGLLPRPSAVVASSHLCDHNVKSFELIAGMADRPSFILDVPYDDGPDAVDYLAQGLRELVAFLEDRLGERLDPDRLAEAFTRSNQAREFLLDVNELRRRPDCPLRGSRAISFLFPTHALIGSAYAVEFFKRLRDDLHKESRNMGPDRCLRILWLYLSPRDDAPVKAVLDDGRRSRIVFEELNQVYWAPLELGRPYHSVARKLLSNPGLGPIRRRLDGIVQMARDFEADGIVHFCNWGCRQSAGSIGLIAQTLEGMGLPFLALDGDAIDPRQGSPGQLHTRMEGFIEILQRRRRDRTGRRTG
jgi:benzoyl-CoA reductase/2-hydroxyglutaryl-CoA dehydratase subunit BcrC/BadD/HgdB